MHYKQYIIKLFLTFALLINITACSDNETGTNPDADAVASEIPEAIQKIDQTTPGTLSAYITIDGGTRIEMEIDSATNTASVTIPGLSRTSHDIVIEYEYTTGGNTYTLATVTSTVDLSSGDTNMAFEGNEFNTNYDSDGDGFNNIDEIASGTNPGATDKPPCIIGTSTIGNCAIG